MNKELAFPSFGGGSGGGGDELRPLHEGSPHEVEETGGGGSNLNSMAFASF